VLFLACFRNKQSCSLAGEWLDLFINKPVRVTMPKEKRSDILKFHIEWLIVAANFMKAIWEASNGTLRGIRDERFPYIALPGYFFADRCSIGGTRKSTEDQVAAKVAKWSHFANCLKSCPLWRIATYKRDNQSCTACNQAMKV